MLSDSQDGRLQDYQRSTAIGEDSRGDKLPVTRQNLKGVSLEGTSVDEEKSIPIAEGYLAEPLGWRWDFIY
jgi:hypothetical protein